MANTGDLCETKAEVTFEWKIKEFYSLSQEINYHYDSNTFHFSGISWEIWIYPNGQAEYSSDGWIGLYIKRISTGYPVTVNYSLSLKSAGGKNNPSTTSTNVFAEKYHGWGRAQVISRSDLVERKSDLTPSDTLTVICTLKNSQSNAVSSKCAVLIICKFFSLFVYDICSTERILMGFPLDVFFKISLLYYSV